MLIVVIRDWYDGNKEFQNTLLELSLEENYEYNLTFHQLGLLINKFTEYNMQCMTTWENKKMVIYISPYPRYFRQWA